jgi:hypothetical protein
LIFFRESYDIISTAFDKNPIKTLSDGTLSASFAQKFPLIAELMTYLAIENESTGTFKKIKIIIIKIKIIIIIIIIIIFKIKKNQQ